MTKQEDSGDFALFRYDEAPFRGLCCIWWPGADRFAKRIRTDDRSESARRASEASQSNHRHADFQSGVRRLLALYFNKLPGRPLPNLHHNA